VLLAGLVNGQAPLRARITKNIDESNLVTISGNVHPLVAAANSSEAADEGMPMEHMILFLKGDAGQEAQLEQRAERPQIISLSSVPVSDRLRRAIWIGAERLKDNL
jgi:hypothetical protein